MWPETLKSGASWMPSSPFSWISETGSVPIVVVVWLPGDHIWTRPSSSM